MTIKFELYDECKKEITEAKENVSKIETLEKNAENYIHDYFDEISGKMIRGKKT